METLPRDIFPNILSTASPAEIMNFCLINKRAYGDVCNNPMFWRVLIRTRWGNIQSTGDAKEYAERYKEDSLKLFDAIQNNDLAYLEELLDRGVDVNIKKYVKDYDLLTPLNYAVLTKNIASAVPLIEAGADVNYYTQARNAVFFRAMLLYREGIVDLEFIKLLLDAGFNFDRKVLITTFIFASLVDRALADLLLDYGIDFNDLGNGYNILHINRKLDTYLTQYLIDLGVDVNKQNNKGQTPLMRRSRSISLDVVRTLLENGARVDLVDNEGHTALDYFIKANRNGRKNDIINLLVQYGAKIGIPFN